MEILKAGSWGAPPEAAATKKTKKIREYVERMLKKPKMVRKGDGNKWLVRSETTDNTYSVLVPSDGGTTFCTCPYFKLGPHRECKHILLIRLATAVGVSHPKIAAEIPGPEGPRCSHCRGYECRELCTRETTRKGDVQRYACDGCGHTFSENPEYGPKWYPPKTIRSSLDLSCRGLSCRDVEAHFKAERGPGEHTPSPKTASRWFNEYIERICAYVDRIVPNASDIWSIDELRIVVKGVEKWLYMVMDYDTKVILGHGVGDTKGSEPIEHITRAARKRAGKPPDIALRDGAPNLAKAIRLTYRTTAGGKPKRAVQVRAHLEGNVTNKQHERVNQTVGARIRIPRVLKSKGSRIISGFVMFYNFIRKHMGLGGKTPAEAAGIKIKSTRPWQALIYASYWAGH